METHNDYLTLEQSIVVASNYLERSRKESMKQYSTHFMLWSAVVMLDAWLIYLLSSFFSSSYIHLLWLLIPIVGCAGEIIINRRANVVVGYIGKLLAKLWIAFGMLLIVILVLGLFFHINIVFSIVSLFALASIFSGLLLQDKRILILSTVVSICCMILSLYFTSASIQIMLIAASANVLFFMGLFLKDAK
jgi:F0F1-type ATP synthase assembly protein I